MNENVPVITSAVRTPLGSLSGALRSLTAPALGSIAIREALKRSNLEGAEVDEVIFGEVLTAGVGQAPARQAALGARIPRSVPCTTINKVCGSSLKAVMLAAQAIRLGDADIVVAGGMESMTNAPYLLERARSGYRLGHGRLVDSMIHDGLWDPYNDFHMGDAAELCAKRLEISREAQDEFAIRSYRRALEAQEKGWFDDEIVPVDIIDAKTGKTLSTVSKDEGPLTVDFDKIPKLRPVFKPDGTVTAANASTINDGASAVIVMSARRARALGIEPLATITAAAQAAKAPEEFTTAPADVIVKILEAAKLTLDDIDLFEINEAFAVVNLAVAKILGIDHERTNVHGGAVALGHPIGASGARILTTLLHALRRRDVRRGLAAICIGGGEAAAVIVER
ncbi:MAG TPA: thiolase family protein [Planctomycetota bacterium]|nr:thiolase family protein [Planctomycetota bacterium]